MGEDQNKNNDKTRGYWARGPVGDPIPSWLGQRTGNRAKGYRAKGKILTIYIYIERERASLTCIDNYW